MDNYVQCIGCCSIISFYIKPQLTEFIGLGDWVVLLLVSTSNHNLQSAITESILLFYYQFLHQTTTSRMKTTFDTELFYYQFLHQTTTERTWGNKRHCCSIISFYIKPQLNGELQSNNARCSIISFYIKPQRCHGFFWYRTVVLLLVSTSNHNFLFLIPLILRLFYYQFLHQTTTCQLSMLSQQCCSIISFYIKPQQMLWLLLVQTVVLLLVSTSNHNYIPSLFTILRLFYYQFLHQTTTLDNALLIAFRCSIISFYIKPQRILRFTLSQQVVLLLVSTSNHNCLYSKLFCSIVVLLLVSTSNHNSPGTHTIDSTVVLLLVSTSNHNVNPDRLFSFELFYYQFLHQTTTKPSKHHTG